VELANRKKILIVDDDQKHLDSIVKILEKEGYEVCLHSQSVGTSRMVMTFLPDLILLDIKMPGVSGDEMAQILQRNEVAKKIPIVFYSALDEDSLYHLWQEHGVAGYIQKGDPTVLAKRIASFLPRTQTS
jgi:CheY-like chemotaxis protein